MSGTEFTNTKPTELTDVPSNIAGESQKRESDGNIKPTDVPPNPPKNMHPLTAFFDWIVHTVKKSEPWKFIDLLVGAATWQLGTSVAISYAWVSAEKGGLIKGVGWVLLGANIIRLIAGVDVLELIQTKIKKWLG